jgi:serine protease Do
MRTLSTCVLGLGLLFGCPGTSQTSNAATTTAHVETKAPRALLEPGDFRKRFIEVAKTIRPAVVTVAAVQKAKAPEPFEGHGSPFDFFFRHPGMPPHGPQERRGMGSGVIIDAQGTIITNNHVVEGADELKVILHDDKELKASIIGTDPKSDVAVIRIDPKALAGLTLTAASLGHSSSLEVGEWVMAIGAPFGLKQTVSAGIVSALGRGSMGITDYEDFVQTDAAINPGNSGGPLINLEGQVIGINTAIASRSGGNQGIGFAIPVDMVRQISDQLITHGSVVRGYIGVFIGDVTPELAESFSFKGRDGVLVQDVSADGPGAAAGLEAGDIVFARDGKPVDDVTVFRNGIAATKPGTKTTLSVFRDGKEIQVEVTLGELPSDDKTAAASRTESTDKPRWGLGLSDITPEAQQRLRLSDRKGALIMQVQPGSPAERAGLRAGDVIVDVAGSEVRSASEATQRMGEAVRDKPLRLRILREGRGLFVLLTPETSD